MTPHAHGGLLVVLVALALGVAVGSVALGALALVRPRRSFLDELAPRELGRLAAVGLCLPVLVGSLFVAATLTVPLVALWMPALDHCAAEPYAPHVCFVHGTWAFSSAIEALGVVLLTTWVSIALGRELLGLRRARQVARSLVDDESATTPVCFTNDDTPFAFTAGLLRPRVIVSAGLERALSDEQLQAALAHELTHARRRHALTRVTTRVLGCLLLPALRRPLLDALVLAQEQEADDEAAAEVGSRTLVAETLLACVRSSSVVLDDAAAPALLGASFAERVEALCQRRRSGRITPLLVVGLSLMAVSAMLARDPLHGASEAVAGVLLSTPVHSHASSHSSDGTE